MKITKQLVKRFEEAAIEVSEGTLGQGNTATKEVTYANGWTYRLEVTYRHPEEARFREVPLVEYRFAHPTSKNSGQATSVVPHQLSHITKDLLDAAFIDNKMLLRKVQEHNAAMKMFEKEMGFSL